MALSLFLRPTLGIGEVLFDNWSIDFENYL